MATLEPDDVRKQAEFDRALRTAHVSRMRGDYEQASLNVVKALELRPSDLEARELAADIFYARGDLDKAAALYKAIHEADPSRASAEEKFAKITLEQAEAKRQQELLQYMLEHPEEARPVQARNPLVAALLSGIPGLGHVYCGETTKGIVLFVATSICWLLFFGTRPDLSYYSPEQKILMFTKNLDAVTVAFLVLGIVLQLYALVNAAAVAENITKEAKKFTEPQA